MGTSGEEGKRNLEYFQRQKLLQLRKFFQKRGIQSSSEGKVDDNGVGRPTQCHLDILFMSCNTH